MLCDARMQLLFVLLYRATATKVLSFAAQAPGFLFCAPQLSMKMSRPFLGMRFGDEIHGVDKVNRKPKLRLAMLQVLLAARSENKAIWPLPRSCHSRLARLPHAAWSALTRVSGRNGGFGASLSVSRSDRLLPGYLRIRLIRRASQSH
jgi:hypothetical protein